MSVEQIQFWTLLAVNVVAVLLLLVVGSIVGKWVKKEREKQESERDRWMK